MKNIFCTFLYELIEWNRNHYAIRYRKEVEDLITYIENHYHERLTLHIISEDLGLKEASISRMFKHETGMNLNYYLNEVRMKKAMELLRDSDMLIKDVANAVGVEDPLYFNKVFKKFYHISPSDIRRKS
jgi:YesN/AraC family two-component response regulator